MKIINFKIIFLIIIFLYILLNSCSRNYVKDVQFEKKINNCLNTVKYSYYGDTNIYSDSLYNCVQYLVLVTGIESNLYVGEIIGYISEEEMKVDITNWSNWFNNNKNHISLEYADSVFNKRLYDLNSPPSSSFERKR